ncbi:hypothetical protein MHU86_10257 [Fragilaria crotonensis]|nr:hypothetical protein MHU86_10257 [Fragilaria crotonensis]
MLKQRMRQFQKTIGAAQEDQRLGVCGCSPGHCSEVKAPSNSLQPSISPQKTALPVVTAESTSASETKEEQRLTQRRRELEPEPESKEAEKPAIEATAEVKAIFKSIAHAAKAVVDQKTEVSAPATEKKETDSENSFIRHLSVWQSHIQRQLPTFGSSSFGKPPVGGGLVFGTSPSILGFGSSTTKDTSSTTSSVFLDMKPPSSTAAPFTLDRHPLRYQLLALRHLRPLHPLLVRLGVAILSEEGRQPILPPYRFLVARLTLSVRRLKYQLVRAKCKQARLRWRAKGEGGE